MGVHSTVSIRREDAIDVLKRALDSDSITDGELGNMLFGLFGDRKLLNFDVSGVLDAIYEYRPGMFELD